MEVVILGAGNVATHLAKALKNKGFTIIQVYSKTAVSAKSLADNIETDFTTEIADIYKHAKIYIYALKDSALESVIAQIDIPNAIHVHTAGSVSIDIFKDKVANYGVLYPLQTFSKTKDVDFSKVPLLVEGNSDETTESLMNIARQISDSCSLANSTQRMKLHLAAVFACNFSNYMYSIAEEIVTESELSFDILKPLIAETADKIKTLAPRAAQTGPAVRYDTNVMDKHLTMLKNNPELADIYKTLSNQIHAAATKK